MANALLPTEEPIPNEEEDFQEVDELSAYEARKRPLDYYSKIRQERQKEEEASVTEESGFAKDSLFQKKSRSLFGDKSADDLVAEGYTSMLTGKGRVVQEIRNPQLPFFDMKDSATGEVVDDNPMSLNYAPYGGGLPALPESYGFATIPESGPSFQPEAVESKDKSTGRDIMNFLFGDEMAILGFKLDNEGLVHDWEVAKQQWSEAPLWINLLATTSLVGTALFPAARAITGSAKFGALAKLGGKIPGKAVELERFKTLGYLDSSVSDLAESELKKLRMMENWQSSHMDLVNKIALAEDGKLTLNPIQKVKFMFQKRFANSYMEITQSHLNGSSARAEMLKRIETNWNPKLLGTLFSEIPEEAFKLQDDVAEYMFHRAAPGVFKQPTLPDNVKNWADSYLGQAESMQKKMLDAAIILPETGKKIGPVHIPAQFKGTPPIEGATKTLFVPAGKPAQKRAIAFTFPRLDSQTLKQRKADYPEIVQRLQSGQLITDPAELTLRGLLQDRLIYNNFIAVRDLAMNKFSHVSSVGADDILMKFKTPTKAKEAGYVSLDDFVGADILKRMIKKEGGALGKGEALPYVKTSVFDEVFGETGMFAQGAAQASLLELLTTMHKTSKTGFSIPTHFQNLVGTFSMLSMAGFNPLAPKNLDLMGSLVNPFNKMAEAHRAARAAGSSSREALESAVLNLGSLTVNGKKMNLSDELLDPQVRELIEESAFDAAEGYQHLVDMTRNLKEGTFTKSVAKGMLKMKKTLQLNDKEGFKWFDSMTKTYLGEDMVPKMAYYLDLRSKGLTKHAAILEVGRRLPMYSTVGSVVKSGRKWAFPWVTFPAEAVRITKNNMMDYPLRMLPWLHGVNGLQALTASALGESPEGIEEGKRQLPLWAQNSVTALMTGEQAAATGGAMTGGLVGAVGGALRGGKTGLAAGAAGAVLGGTGAKLLADYTGHDEALRGMVMDWIPHSSFMLTSTSPDIGGEYLPFKDFQGALEQFPVEPMGIFRPLMDILSGRTAFGTEIKAESTGEQVEMAFAGLLGFLMPPFFQKYGLTVNTPDISVTQAITGKDIPGDFTNIRRALTDTGQAIDSNTGKPGSLTHDFLLKNIGLGKSWEAMGTVQLANEANTERHMKEIRGAMARNMKFHIENGNDYQIKEILIKVMNTFTKQYVDNPGMAQRKFTEWAESQHKTFGNHPYLRGYSEEEFLHRWGKATEHAAVERGRARQQLLKVLEDQWTMRQMGKTRGAETPGEKALEKRGLF